jgi:hypothetical protein
MATGGPAGTLLNPQCMIRAADKDLASFELLEVALHAQIGIADRQHFGIH